jgi:hypothetical protein
VATHPDVPKQGQYIFRTSTTQAVEGPYLADFAVKHLKAKRIAEICVNTDWGNSARKFFVDRVRGMGAEIVIEESYNPGDVEFTAKLLKIKGLNPDLLELSSLYTDGALIMKQARKVGLMSRGIGTFLSTIPNSSSWGDSVEDSMLAPRSSPATPIPEWPILSADSRQNIMRSLVLMLPCLRYHQVNSVRYSEGRCRSQSHPRCFGHDQGFQRSNWDHLFRRRGDRLPGVLPCSKLRAGNIPS